jgi:hypothetical protein
MKPCVRQNLLDAEAILGTDFVLHAICDSGGFSPFARRGRSVGDFFVGESLSD